MADQNVASYDPVFWFYHANIDRLWWRWQRKVRATTLTGFQSTIDGDAGWLSDPVADPVSGAQPPFTTTKGELSNATFGFASIFLKAIEELKPQHMAAALDLPTDSTSTPDETGSR